MESGVAHDKPKRVKSGLLFYLLGVVFSVGIFAYLFSVVPLGKVLLTFRELSPYGLLAFVLLSFTGSLLRAWRYQLVLRWGGHQVQTLPLFLITLVRNLCADLLPARLGTVIYIYLTHKRLGIPLTSSTTSFSLALFFDLVTLPFVLLFFLLFEHDLGLHGAVLPGLAVVALGCLIVLWQLPWFMNVAIALLGKLQSSLIVKIREFLESIAQEVQTIRHPRELIQLFTLSLGVRLTKYLSLILFLYALLLPLGYTSDDLPFVKAFIGILSSEVAASLPASGIAGFGLYEGTWALTFRLLGVSGGVADLTALSHHLFTQVYGYSLGALGFLALLAYAPRYRTLSSQGPISWLKFSIKVLFVLLTMIVCLSLASYTTEAKSEAPEDARTSAYQQGSLPENLGIVYDSNLLGSFGIYYLSHESRSPRALFDSSDHEMYPDVSDTQQEIIFARSKTTKRLEPGTIWALKYGEKEPELLVEDGTFPTYTGNGRDFIFERRRSAVFLYERDKKKATRLFPTKKRNSFRGFQIVKPRLSQSGRYLVFTSDRPAPWHTWMIDLETGEEKILSQGCEPVMHPGGNFGVFIEQHTAVGGSGIYRFTPHEKGVASYYDPSRKLNHEYFPSFDATGQYLAFSACPEREHSHLTANYELFLKDLNQDGEAIQLTDGEATNRWPKITRVPWEISGE